MGKCFKCGKIINLLTTVRTLDHQDLCNEDYGIIADLLKKGVFTSEEAYKVMEGQKSLLTSRNNKLRIMLQATLLNGDDATVMVNKFNKKFKELSKEVYNKNVKDVSSHEKTNLINLIYEGYKDTFGDFGVTECLSRGIRDEKGMYYEFLYHLNNDLEVINEFGTSNMNKILEKIWVLVTTS